MGEEGPEIVNLPQGSKINSNQKSKGMLKRPDLYSMFGVEEPDVAAKASGLGSSAGESLGFNAKGTDNWKGGLTVVGEEGPEIIKLPQGTQINSTQKSRAMLERPDLYSMFGLEDPVVATNASGQTSGAGSGSGSRATSSGSASLARVPPPVIVIEPSRVGPSEPRIPREPERQLNQVGVGAAPAMAQDAPAPVIEVQNYNYFDRDKLIGDYIDSPQGRNKTVNVVREENASGSMLAPDA